MLSLFTDTDTDLTPAIAAGYGYKLISMPFSVDGETVYPYANGSDFDLHAFYDMLREGKLPTTSAIGEKEYADAFEPEFAAGNDVLYVHFSRKMTVTFDVMDKVVAGLLEKYPGRKFYDLDTKGITIISYLIVRELGDRLNAGMTPEEAVEWCRTEADHYSQYFFADDLKFFRRSGRVSGLAATMGGLIGLRPVIHMSSDGKMVSLGTVKGRLQVMEKLIGYVEEFGDDIKNHRFIVGHTDTPALAEQLAGMLKEKFGDDLEIEYVCANPVAGAHCGPNGVGLAFHSKGR